MARIMTGNDWYYRQEQKIFIKISSEGAYLRKKRVNY